MTNVFVTGGSGFIGQHLVKKLKQNGAQVFVLARSRDAATSVSALGATPVMGDLLRPESLNKLHKFDTVFHLAGTLDHGPGPEAMLAINTGGTKNIVEYCKKIGVKKLVYLSSLAVIADGSILTDIDEQHPMPKKNIGSYASSKAEAEKIVLSAADEDLATVIIRAPFVWGPGDNFSLPKLIESIKNKYFSWIDQGNYLFSTCHVYNLVAGLAAAASFGKSKHVYYIQDGETLTIRQFLETLIETQGIKVPSRSTSRKTLKLICDLIELPWRLLPLRSHNPTHLRETMVLMGQPFYITSRKAESELHYEPVISFDEGFSEMRKDGLLRALN